MKAKPTVNIVYTNRGTFGIENQTRYSTDAILALANAIESCVHPEMSPFRPKGAVLCIVDWRHNRPPSFVRRYKADGVSEHVSVKQYVTLRDSMAWDTIRVVPPDLLFSDPIEAISWDGQFAPLEVTRQLADRIRFEMGLPVWKMAEQAREKPELLQPLPVAAERGSRKRGANASVALASRAESRARKAHRQSYRARWETHSVGRNLDAAQRYLSVVRPDLAERLELRRQELDYLHGRLIEITQDLNDTCNTIRTLDLTRKE